MTDQNRKPKILVIDDEADLLAILSTMAEEFLDAETQIAKNGKVALEILEEKTFDVITTDVQMPIMDGFTFFKELRARGNKTPVIFLTANGTHEMAADVLALGGFDYIDKPVNHKEWIALLKEAVKVSKKMQQLNKKASA